MDREKVFRTKTGFCHILPDKIVLTRDGFVGEIAKITIGKGISRILIIYSFISIGFFYYAFTTYKSGQIFLALIFGLLGGYLIFGILTSLNNSATPIIMRDKIKDVKYKKAISGITRSRFEVYFENEDRKIKKRLIILPGTLDNGKIETDKALEIMSEENLIKNS